LKKRPHQYVALVIREAGIGPLLFDLLTAEGEAVDMYTWISSAAEEKFTDPIRLSDPALAS
jgi:hypothetical protein